MSPRLRIVAFLLFGTVFANSAARAADPFYERLLREGSDAYNLGDFVRAIKYLRIANFGFLEEPELLAQGLAFLALAQAQVQDAEGFRETFLRVAEVEERFRAYTRADIQSDVREVLERMISELVPQATLEAAPSFSHLASRKEDSRLTGLSGNARRRELRNLIEEQPGEPRWRLMLAQMDLDGGDTDDAIQNASVVLEYDPDNGEALLIRGLAMAEEKRWDAAVVDLAASGRAGRDVPRAEALLRAYVELERWGEASTFMSSLPEDIRNARSIQGLVQQVERNQPAGGTLRNSTVPDSLSQDEADDLDRARTILTRSTDREELLEAYQLARTVADKKPDSARAQHLAGEAAYRLARWTEAVAYFRRGGKPPESRPVTSFYMAVSLYESGEREEAAEIMRSCVQKLQRTPFVESYITKILGTGSRP